MNAKKVLAQVGVIMSIVSAAIFVFLFLIDLPNVEEAVHLMYKGRPISEEEFRLIVVGSTIVMVFLALFAAAILTVAIVSEVRMNKKKNHKGLLIALLILNLIYGILLLMGNLVLGLLLFVASTVIILVSICLKEEPKKPVTELEQKHDNENVLF